MPKNYKLTKTQFATSITGIVAIIAIILLFTTDLLEDLNPNKTYDLEKTLKSVYNLDKKYNTNWREENVPLKLIQQEKILPYLTDLEKLYENAKNKSPSSEIILVAGSNYQINISERILDFLNARKEMLTAQKYYYESSEIGDKGIIDFEYRNTEPFITETVDCDNIEYLSNATQILNKTISAARNAMFLLDKAMISWVEGQEKIGVNEYRAQFYTSRLGRINTQIELNEWSIKECLKKKFIKEKYKNNT
ncbi:hypothetical protein HYV79_00665 [Candidatus Woesearchaeota archaeon]|nr:hypothetical protein [Candidatus Woesearchaeota archaeon]